MDLTGLGIPKASLMLLMASLTASFFTVGSYANQTLKIAAPIEAKHAPEIVTFVVNAYQLVDVNVEIMHMPAKRSLHEAANNSVVDAELARVEAAQVSLPNYIRIKEPLLSVSLEGFVLKGKPLATSWTELADKRVVTVRGFVGLTKELNQRQISFYKTGTSEQALSMVESQCADIAILPSFIRDEGIIENIEKFQYHQIEDYTLYHFIHSRHSKLVPSLTDAFRKLKAKGVTKDEYSVDQGREIN